MSKLDLNTQINLLKEAKMYLKDVKPISNLKSEAKKDTVALRIPKYGLVNELLKKTNLPLTGTSANLSGKPPSTKIKEVIRQFKNQKHQPDLIINLGNLRKSKPSTILDLRVFPPKILRI